ncbi:MAG TPA: type II secretion system F family protein [Mycobacteriales bacterium]|nr:type II secretion system F family protein [Mycobacteriales bacterium]
MSTTALGAILGGAICGGGLLLFIASLVGWIPPRDDSKPPALAGIQLSRVGQQILIAAVATILTFLITGWIVAAIAAALLGFFGRSFVGGARASRAEMQRLEELASWTESLRDTIAGAVGLEQAIPASINATGPALRRHVVLLVDRLRTREPLADALMKFAADLDDPSADLIISALILNARLRGPGLRDVLGSLSNAARQELEMRGRIEASRRSTRRSVQIIIGITVAVVLGLTLLNPTYVQPYDSALGQIILIVIFGFFTGGLLWLRALAQYQVPSRFLTGRSVVPPAEREPAS